MIASAFWFLHTNHPLYYSKHCTISEYGSEENDSMRDSSALDSQRNSF